MTLTFVVPVRNGGAYLRPCLDSILAQRREDFEVIVLDNASDDGTAEALASIDDPRVRVERSEHVLSIEDNWARIRDLDKRALLTVLGHDDLVDPDFYDVMADLAARAPDAPVLHARFRLIDARGRVLRLSRSRPAHEDAASFLRARLRGERDSFGTGYVFRSEVFDRVGGMPPLHRLLYADDALVLLTARRGGIASTPSVCVSYRLHAGSVSGGAGQLEQLEAMAGLQALVGERLEAGSSIAEVFNREWPAHVLSFARGWRYQQLLAATLPPARGTRTDDADITEALSRLDPTLAERFAEETGRLTKLGVLRSIVKRRASRALYRQYLRLRYGDHPLASSSPPSP